MRQNPIKQVRNELGITNAELAAKLGISHTWLHKVLLGYPQKLSPQIRRGLKRLGYDADEISREYVKWRSQKFGVPQEEAAEEAAPAAEPETAKLAIEMEYDEEEPAQAQERPSKPTFKRFRNLTPHPVYIYVNGLDAPITIPPDPHGPARVMVRHVEVTNIAGVPVWITEPMTIVGLPDPDPDVGLIVSKVVADTMRGTRYDLLTPDVIIRDKDGHIIGARGLSWMI